MYTSRVCLYVHTTSENADTRHILPGYRICGRNELFWGKLNESGNTFINVESNIDECNYLQEFLKATVDLADLVGMYVVLAGIPGKGHSKVLTAGIGWATAEVILSRALLLWVGARGAEFDWKYIQKCLESNVSLIQHITTVTLIWLWSRHDLSR